MALLKKGNIDISRIHNFDYSILDNKRMIRDNSGALYLCGNEYDVSGGHYHSIAGIILVLASLGVTKLVLLFGSLLLITGISMYKKYKNPIIKNTLAIKR